MLLNVRLVDAARVLVTVKVWLGGAELTCVEGKAKDEGVIVTVPADVPVPVNAEVWVPALSVTVKVVDSAPTIEGENFIR